MRWVRPRSKCTCSSTSVLRQLQSSDCASTTFFFSPTFYHPTTSTRRYHHRKPISCSTPLIFSLVSKFTATTLDKRLSSGPATAQCGTAPVGAYFLHITRLGGGQEEQPLGLLNIFVFAILFLLYCLFFCSAYTAAGHRQLESHPGNPKDQVRLSTPGLRSGALLTLHTKHLEFESAPKLTKMSSSIFFKFKSQKATTPITFDGSSLSVFEVKREIITLSRLGDEYDDDTTQVPRSTTVIASRLPAQKPGAGRAARYVNGKMPITAKNQHRIEASSAPVLTAPSRPAYSADDKEMTEEEKMAAMFNATSEAWKADQAQMANKPVIRSNYNKSAAVPDKALPPGYICHRCGDKGHWIQACPTNNDPTFDGRPKIKRTTGIPRSMLKKLEPTEFGEDGKIDISKLPPGAMRTANNEWVLPMTDEAAWEKYKEKHDASHEKAKELSADIQEIQDRGLSCPLDKHLLKDPVVTPCCGTTYCRDCIENALLDGDLLCPHCGEQVLLDKLVPDDDMAAKIHAYEEEKKDDKHQMDEVTDPLAMNTPRSIDGKSPDPAVDGAESAASTPNPRKRAAEEELDNDRKPANPADPTKLTSAQGTPKPAVSKPIPSAPKAMQQQQQSNKQQVPLMPMTGNIQDFAKQMNAMAGTMGGSMSGMPAMMNPMSMSMGMGMNPMMGMNMMNGMGGFGGMPGMNMNMVGGNYGNGMNGFNNGMGGMNAFNGNMGMGMGMGMGGWQGNGGQGWNPAMANNGLGATVATDGAYFRPPINTHRQQNRQRRPREADYKQM
nr:putative ring finger protein p8b7.15c [Quercus suber]